MIRGGKASNKLNKFKKGINVSRIFKKGIKNKKTGELFKSIRFQLIVAFMVPIAFIILIGIISFLKASDGITTSYEKSTSKALNMAGEYLQLGFDTIKVASDQYGNDEGIKNYLIGIYESDIIEKSSKLKEINNNFITKSKTDKFIGDIYILSDRYEPISTISKIDTEVYEGFKDTDLGKFTFDNKVKISWTGSDTYLDEQLMVGSNQYALRLVRMIIGTNSVLIMDVEMETVQEVLKNLEFDETGILGIVTKDGKEIGTDTSEQEPAVTETVGSDGSEEPIFTDKTFYEEALEAEEMKGSKLVQYNNEPYLFMFSKLGDTGAMICGLVPRATILKQADSIKNITILVVIIATFIAVGIAVLISTGISNTIKTIIEKLKIAAKGDLTVNFDTKRRDEFRILIEEIQNTFFNMKNLIQQVKNFSSDVSTSSENVTLTSQHFLRSTEEISVSMNEIEAGIMQQAKDAEECLYQMDNLSKKIVTVSDSVKQISSIADNTKKNVHQGIITSDDLNTQTKETMRITTDIIKEIMNLEKKSASINNIISVINEIANQTNLLSLNASIEAARAGDAGRGFAVVASEIRTLADQSKNSVSSIKSIIDSIQKDTKAAVNIAREAENVMHLQVSAVKNTTESYQNINESVEGLVVQLQQISENVDNIEEARANTLGAIESISAVLEEIAASTNTVNQTSGKQLSSVEILNKSAGGLNKNAGDLVQAVENFKV